MFRSALKALVPALALAAAPLLAACGQMNVSIDGEEGVPLAKLDMTGAAPTKIVLAGPDTVVVSEGEKLAITVDDDGANKEDLRFSLKEGTLGVMRKSPDGWSGPASTVRVTMPMPQSAVVAGSGKLELPGLAGKSELVVAGSGTASARTIAADKLSVTVAGSGRLDAGGRADMLDLTIAGSGEANMRDLKVDKAKVTIAGSGDAAFASDGTVDATVMGSGHVRVAGNATCTIEAIGSGKLTCANTATAGKAAAGGGTGAAN